MILKLMMFTVVSMTGVNKSIIVALFFLDIHLLFQYLYLAIDKSLSYKFCNPGNRHWNCNQYLREKPSRLICTWFSSKITNRHSTGDCASCVCV